MDANLSERARPPHPVARAQCNKRVETQPGIKGRGCASQLPGRFATVQVERDEPIELLPHPDTELRRETARSLITSNRSPDVPFRLSINPYRGCEHGCVYCFARPSHAYLDLSPGIDFETRLSVKHNAPELFEQELRRPNYRCEPIALGVNTDAYQPVEREQGVVRRLLETALAFGQPLSIITKSRLILRDLDLLSEMAARQLIHVAVSVTTLDNGLKRIMEPRAASPAARLQVIAELTAAGVPVTALVAPVIPAINEDELESIVAAVAQAGAQSAVYILLRLPHEVETLFVDWLHRYFPERAGRVLSQLSAMRGGKLYDNRFGTRMTGQGVFATLINQRFHLALRKAGLDPDRTPELDCGQFQAPPQSGDQMVLI